MAWLGKRRFAVAVVAMAACSAALMWVLFDPASDPSRVYFGTDTRAAGLLLGCLLAFVWAPGRLKRDISASASYVLDGIGLVALALLIRMLFDTDEFSASLYRGGFLRLDALTLVVIAVAVHPGARLGTWLGARPLRWIGLRSYGIYLWHWPVYQLTRPGLDVPFDGAALLALRLAITFGIAELSYRFVEMPARTGAIGRWWRRRSERARARPGGSSTLALGVSAFAAALALLVLAAVRAEPPPPVDYLAIGTGDTEPTAPITTSTTAPPPTTAPATPGQAPPPTTGTTTPTTIPPPVVPIDDPVTAVGDSVMFGASNALVALGPGMTVDAEVSRQVHVGIEVLERRRAEGTLGEIILVHLGNNGLIRSEQFDRIMEIAEGRRVIFMAVKVPRQWEAHNNDVLRDGVARHPGALLIDWKAQVEAAGAGILYDDGMHVMPAGADLYATLVSETIRHSIRSVP